MGNHRANTVLCALFALFFVGMAALCLFLPRQTESESERRKLAELPRLTAANVLSGRFMERFETYAQDHFPARDAMRTLKAQTATRAFGRLDNNGIYVADGYAAAMEYPMNADSLAHAAGRMQHLYETYLSPDTPVYLAVIPDKNRVLAPVSGRLSMDYDALRASLAEQTPFAQEIPLFDLLPLSDYYRTDTHWRQECILDVAARLAQAMGVPFPQEGWRSNTLPQDFYGVYAGQAALPMTPDRITYLTHPLLEHCRVQDGQNDREIPLYDLARADGRDPYEVFLSGPLSLVTIENPQALTDRSLVLVRDSFGSSLAPLLAASYRTITLVDIRYVQPEQLGRWVSFEGSDVLFAYSTLVLNNSRTLK